MYSSIQCPWLRLMRKRQTWCSVIVLFSLLPSVLFAQQSDNLPSQANAIELKSTIIGNQEQPEVIHILPWQTISAPDPAYNPIGEFVSRDLNVVDRRQFNRKIQLDQAMRSEPYRSENLPGSDQDSLPSQK